MFGSICIVFALNPIYHPFEHQFDPIITSHSDPCQIYILFQIILKLKYSQNFLKVCGGHSIRAHLSPKLLVLCNSSKILRKEKLCWRNLASAKKRSDRTHYREDPGFFACVFTVPKKTRGLRLIIELKVMDSYISAIHRSSRRTTSDSGNNYGSENGRPLMPNCTYQFTHSSSNTCICIQRVGLGNSSPCVLV